VGRLLEIIGAIAVLLVIVAAIEGAWQAYVWLAALIVLALVARTRA
jgi:hypothetical protein